MAKVKNNNDISIFKKISRRANYIDVNKLILFKISLLSLLLSLIFWNFDWTVFLEMKPNNIFKKK